MLPVDLPEHLCERVSAQHRELRADGEFVLYWMHHAVRADENPALDTALHVAQSLHLPLLVYQGLGGTHRYDSDRHHTFILEGARDVAVRFAERGIRYVFHLATQCGAAAPLNALASRAALVVTEDFPVPPFPVWGAKLAEKSGATLWRVDTACIVPMRLVGQAYSRAFEFRRAWGRELERRAALDWPTVAMSAEPYRGSLGFEPVDVARADIAALCAACSIDHSVGPVPDTRGGQQAGEVRWRAFRKDGLASYDRLRNDALVQPPRGVSRISPYLHHGHLSPLRIAREALSHNSSGARKFLDELLIWRELAHNFCYQHAHLPMHLESLDALPSWARETLIEHRDDRRHGDYSWERLARGRTGDTLWDAAQASLRVHGELHNNVRMTWGKTLLRWSADPQRALDLLIDLNHRYALDGSDPNSYGGLLWCLGLFDRPFRPPQPIYGTVRTRPSHAHAARLDVATYGARARRRANRREPEIAVIGAGMAGLAAARSLTDQGFNTTVFERADKVGGRMATRVVEHHTFDHGAQYFTAREPLFRRYVASWIEEKCVVNWDGRLLNERRSQGDVPEHRYVGAPTMRALAEHLADDLDLRLQTPVASLVRDKREWLIGDDRFDAVVLAVAPEQAVSMLECNPALAARVKVIDSLPCWSAMVAFDTELSVRFDGAFLTDSPLAWVARDSSKPGRSSGERWVLHATPAWSAERLDESPRQIAESLLTAFFNAFDLTPLLPIYLAGHRWRYARAGNTLGDDCLWDVDSRLAVCGDWCRNARIEDAFLSGVAAAGRLVGALTR